MSTGSAIVRGDQVRPEFEFRHVLVLTDFSRGAKSALKSARSIARKCSSKLFILHVIPTAAYQFISSTSAAETLLLAREFADQEMRTLLEEGKSQGFEEQGIVAEGLMWPTISETIRSFEIDLIAMGTHNGVAEKKLCLGSVAEQIYRMVDCPILTAPPENLSSDKSEIQRLLFATNFKPHSERAACAAHSLGCGPNKKLTVLHVIDEPRESSQQSNKIVREFLVKRMAKSMPAICNDCAPEYEIRFGRPAEEIVAASSELHSDLIFLGVRTEPRTAGHLPSALVYNIVCNSKCPVLTLHQK
jgi:nucleotide-binding universal stress UspA family protein